MILQVGQYIHITETIDCKWLSCAISILSDKQEKLFLI